MTDNRKNCPMRHENGNCTVIGGFCTAVNDYICEGLHNAYDCGQSDFAIRLQEERENPEPLTIEELCKVDGEPVFLVDLVHKSDPTVSDLWGGWIVFTNHNQNGFIPRGGGFFSNYGYGKSWIAYRSKPKEE